MNDRSRQYSLLLLAGGKSSRMGSNKAELIYEGKTFADLLTEKAEKLGIEEIVVSGYAYKAGEAEDAAEDTPDEQMDREEGKNRGAAARRHIRIIWDQYTDRGPLGGLHACMKAIKTPFCLVLPVDAPRLPQNILEELIHRHETCRAGLRGEKEIPLIWEHDDRKEPLIAVYPVAMADSIGELIKEKAAPVFRMLDRWGYECYRLEMDKPQVINVNTPELYRELLESTECVKNKEDTENAECAENKEDTENAEYAENKEDTENAECVENKEDTENAECVKNKEDTENAEYAENKEDTENAEYGKNTAI